MRTRRCWPRAPGWNPLLLLPVGACSVVLLLLLLLVLGSLEGPPSRAASASRRSMKLLGRRIKLRLAWGALLGGVSSGACCS